MGCAFSLRAVPDSQSYRASRLQICLKIICSDYMCTVCTVNTGPLGSLTYGAFFVFSLATYMIIIGFGSFQGVGIM